MTFVGFDLTVDRRRAGTGWFFVIAGAADRAALRPRRRPTAAAAAQRPTSWSDLDWGHVGVAPGGHLRCSPTAALRASTLPIAERPARRPASARPTSDENAAHMAAITFQRPFRAAIHSAEVLGQCHDPPRDIIRLKSSRSRSRSRARALRTAEAQRSPRSAAALAEARRELAAAGGGRGRRWPARRPPATADRDAVPATRERSTRAVASQPRRDRSACATPPSRRQSRERLVAGLDGQVPIALLPVRLETRFAARPPQPAHPRLPRADPHRRPRARADRARARGRRRSTGARAGRRRRRRRARARGVAASWRAHVPPAACALARHRDDTRPTSPTLGRGEPLFPDVAVAAAPWTRAARAALLPEHWVALGYRGGAEVFRAWGATDRRAGRDRARSRPDATRPRRRRPTESCRRRGHALAGRLRRRARATGWPITVADADVAGGTRRRARRAGRRRRRLVARSGRRRGCARRAARAAR